jgi:hypothetical protein
MARFGTSMITLSKRRMIWSVVVLVLLLIVLYTLFNVGGTTAG